MTFPIVFCSERLLAVDFTKTQKPWQRPGYWSEAVRALRSENAVTT